MTRLTIETAPIEMSEPGPVIRNALTLGIGDDDWGLEFGFGDKTLRVDAYRNGKMTGVLDITYDDLVAALEAKGLQ